MADPNDQANLASVLEKLISTLKPKALNSFLQSDNQMQNLMIVHAKVPNGTTNASQTLEIRVMGLVYQEGPSIALIFTDITERNLVVKLQDTNDYKNRLLASVSHELRTPLNASLNFIQAAIEDPQTPAHIREEYLTPSLTSSQLLLHLINDILDFSQMSVNKLRLVYETCDVKKTLNDCINLMKMQATKKGLGLSLDVEVETPDSEFSTDHNRLKQIVLNLLSNAVKFTLKGMIRVKATLSETVDNGKVLHVAVTDTGIGISSEDQKKLFKSFEKIDLGEKAFLNSTGAGLGLVISSNLVLMLGPEDKSNGLQIKSQLGQGSTFSFRILNKKLRHPKAQLNLSDRSENFDNQMDELDLPRETTQQFETLSNIPLTKPPTMKRNRLISATGATTNDQISIKLSQPCLCPPFLIVDDDIFNITALSTILKQLGHTCNAAYNGQQAIEKALERQNVKCGHQCRQYKMIFMDFSMPIMDGFEAARRLKGLMRDGEISKITIIGCTAFVQEHELQRGIEAGMDEHCTKPLNRNKISAFLFKLSSQVEREGSSKNNLCI